MFSIARNDKTARIPRDLRKGIEVVNACYRIIHECLFDPYQVSKNSLHFWALENPASGYLKRFLGNPPFIFTHQTLEKIIVRKRQSGECLIKPKKTTKGTVIKGDANNYVKSVERYFKRERNI